MFELKGKTAVVTGAKQGIGKGIAALLAKAGARVVVSDCDLRGVQETAKEIGGKAFAVKCDVSNARDVDSLVKTTVKKFGSLDVLVNNAGIYPFKPFTELTEADWQRVMDVNLKGVFLCTRAATKQMIAQKTGGKVVSISSIASLVGFSGLAHYCASKGGINAFTRAVALELAPYKINVNAVAPGAIQTPGVGEVDPKTLEQTLAFIPWKRMGLPQDIAAAVLFLCSKEAGYITGQTLVVDGGYVLQ